MTDEQLFDIGEWQVIPHHVDLIGTDNTAPSRLAMAKSILHALMFAVLSGAKEFENVMIFR